MKAIQVTWEDLCHGKYDRFGIEMAGPREFYTPSIGILEFHAAGIYDPHYHPRRALVVVGGWFVTVGNRWNIGWFVNEDVFKVYYKRISGDTYQLRGIAPRQLRQLVRKQVKLRARAAAADRRAWWRKQREAARAERRKEALAANTE